MRKRKNLIIILILAILFSPIITTLEPRLVEASIATEYEAAEKEGEIYLLAESAHKVKCCTSTGSNFDDAYFKNTMMHEMSTLILADIVQDKPIGWRSFFSSPPWFGEGFEENIAVKYGADTKRWL